VIERAVILSPGPVLEVPASDLQLPRRRSGPAIPLADSQRRAIMDAIRAAGGKIGGPNGAAARLGPKRATLQSRMRKLGVH
jgi:formate hydrogenlyase transcriptional activator